MGGAPVDSQSSLEEAQRLKAQSESLGMLTRAGVESENAAERVGLAGLRFTGERPVSLRPPGE